MTMNSAIAKWLPQGMLKINTELLVVGVITGCGLWAYFPVFHNGFVTWDTAGYVLQNERIKHFSWENLGWMFSSYHMSNWHPLTWLSHAIDYYFFGLNPVGHHAVNLIFHLANSLLVFSVAKKVLTLASHLGSLWIPAVAGILFAVHPQHVESVAWVAERKDVLCAFFYILTIRLHLKYAGETQFKYRWYVMTSLSTAMALLAKPMAVSIPFVLLLLDIYPLARCNFPVRHINQNENRQSLIALTTEKWHLFVMVVIVAIISFIVQYQSGAVAGMEKVDLVQRVLNAMNSLFLYLSKWLIPINLSPFYQFPSYIANYGSIQAMVPVFGFLGVTLLCVWLWSKNQYQWLIAWLIYCFVLLPVIGIVQIGDQAAADRYTYLSTIPLYMLVCSGINSLYNKPAVHGKRWYNVATLTGFAILALSLGELTRHQTEVWKNDLVFWQYTADHAPQSGVVRSNYGHTLLQVGQIEAAIKELEAAAKLRKSATINKWLADAYLEHGDFALAKQHYHMSLAINEDKKFITVSEIFVGMAKVAVRQKNYIDARKFAAEATRLDSKNSQALILLKKLQSPDNINID